MTYAQQVADRAKKDLEKRLETLNKEIVSREDERKEINEILDGLAGANLVKSTPAAASPKPRATTRRKSRTSPQKSKVAKPATTEPKKTGRPSHKDRILRCLAEKGSLDRDEIAKFLDTSEQTVRGVINEMVRDQQIKIVGEDNNERIVPA